MSERQPQETRPDRIVYSITEDGRAELRRWLQKPTNPQKERIEVLLKLFFGLEMPVEKSIEHVKRCSDIEDWLVRERAEHPNLPFWLLTVWCGQYVSRAYVDWCNEALTTLKKLAEGRAAATER